MTKKSIFSRWVQKSSFLLAAMLAFSCAVHAQANFWSVFGNAGCSSSNNYSMPCTVTPSSTSFTSIPLLNLYGFAGYTNNDYFKNSVYDASGHLLFSVNANGIFAPPNAKGFARHWDTHDIFVLQVYGQKNWHIFDTEIELPTTKQSSSIYESALKNPERKLSKEIKFTVGNLFYLPRGVIHSADTEDAASIHISIGLNSFCWDVFFKEMLNDIDSDITFRKTVPFWNMDELEQGLSECIKAINKKFENDNKQRTINSLLNKVNNHRLQDSRFWFKSLLNIAELNIDSTIQMNENIQLSIVKDDHHIYLNYYGKSIGFPLSIKASVEYSLTTKNLSVSSIPDLDDESKIIFVRKLIEEGLFFICE